MSLPFVDLKTQYARIQDQVRANMDAVLAHGQYIMGPEVAECERQLAAYAGTKHCLTCGSGTDALLMALMALGIGPGHGVLTTPFTFIATVEAIALVGATPVFVDIDPRTFNMDPRKLREVLEGLGETHPGVEPKAVMPVDLFGLPAEYEEIGKIAGEFGLEVINDAAQGFGADYKCKKAVAWAKVACTSFFPAKPLGCYGDGGAVFTDDDELAAAMASVRVHGMGEDRYHNVRLGLNARFDTLQAAVILAKLPIYEEEIEARRAVAYRYSEALADVAVVPEVPPHCTSVWAQYTIQVPGRDGVRAKLGEQGVPSAVYYPLPCHLQPVFAHLGYTAGSMPVCEDLAAKVLSLPVHPYLTQNDQGKVIQALLHALS